MANPKKKIIGHFVSKPQKLESSNNPIFPSKTWAFGIQIEQTNQPKQITQERQPMTPTRGSWTHSQGSSRSLTTFLKLRSCASGNTWHACVRLGCRLLGPVGSVLVLWKNTDGGIGEKMGILGMWGIFSCWVEWSLGKVWGFFGLFCSDLFVQFMTYMWLC